MIARADGDVSSAGVGRSRVVLAMSGEWRGKQSQCQSRQADWIGFNMRIDRRSQIIGLGFWGLGVFGSGF